MHPTLHRDLPVTLAFVALLASAVHVVHAAAQGPTNERRGPLMLADEEFWGDTERTRDAVVAEFAKSDFHGILLDGPKRVSLTSRNSLPIMGYFVRSLEDDRLLNQERQMVVVAVNQRTGQVLSGMALQSGKIPAPQAKTPRNPANGTQVNMFNFDLRQTLSMPWASGWYRVTVLLGRFISNTVVVELAGEGGAAMPAATGGSARIELLRTGTGRSGCKVSGQLVLDAPTSAAVAPANVTLLVTSLRTPGPWTVTLDAAPTGQERLGGRFGADLMRSSEMPHVPDLYFVYAFSRWAAAGPVQCRVGGKLAP